MAETTFEPVADETEVNESEVAEPSILDLDDPRLSESKEINPDADYNQYLIPPEFNDVGKIIEYDLRITLGENDEEKTGVKKGMYFKSTKKSGVFGVLKIEHQIVDPGGEFDGYRIPAQWLTTIIRNGTDAVANLCRLADDPMPKKITPLQEKEHAERVLGSGPIVRAKLGWQPPSWQDKETGEQVSGCSQCHTKIEGLFGQRNWAVRDESGEVTGYSPIQKCDTCGSDVYAKPIVKRFLERI